MNDNHYLWYEICDCFDEYILYLRNEVNYFKYLFERNDINSLLNITLGFDNELNNIRLLFEIFKINLMDNINNEVSNHYVYSKMIELKFCIYRFMQNLKYLTYSIFDTNLKKRIEHIEVMKNHQVARNLCKYISSKIISDVDIDLESHFGYDYGYYCISLYENEHAIINAPRNTLFCTRYLPINCHEVAHPFIDYKWNEIKTDTVFKDGYLVTRNYILKHFHPDRPPLERTLNQIVATVYSEILADIISVTLMGKSFVWAAISSFLIPTDIVRAKKWLNSISWRTHPPNKLRFFLISEILKLKDCQDDYDFIKRNWETVSNLQNNYETTQHNTFLTRIIEEYINEIKLEDIYNRFKEEDSPIRLEEIDIETKFMSEINYNTEPVTLLDSVWNSRIKRYLDEENLYERNTMSVLNSLNYSLQWRKEM